MPNTALYRRYMLYYLQHNPDIHSGGNFTCLVRTLEQTSDRVILQVYAFTKTTEWQRHEEIKSDILEDILVTMKDFEIEAVKYV